MRILVIEDQKNLAQLIKNGLEAEGFAADFLLDGEQGLSRIMLYHEDYDLVILDLMLPKKSGLEVLTEIREKKVSTPVLILTANNSPQDVSKGLNLGADDYLVKPFSFDVLIARIRAILRRPKVALPVELVLNGIKIASTNQKVFKDGRELDLTLKEYSLLEYFMRHPNQVLNREQILSNVWDFAFDSFSNVVDVHITNLRKKLEDKKGKIIETVRGIGYRFNNK